MAVAFRAISTGTGTDATGEGTIPVGTAAGDLMIAFVAHSASTATITGEPSGWTLQEADPNPADFSLWCYTRKWQSGDTNPTWTFSAAGGWTVDIVSYSGVDTTTPVNADVGGQAAAVNAITLSVTPSVANCMLVAFGDVDATGTLRTWTEDGSMTERLEQLDNAMHRVVADELLSGGSGASQSRTLTFIGTAQDVGGFLLALAPSAAPAAVALTPAILTFGAQALSPIPGPVTVALTPAVLTFSAVSLTPIGVGPGLVPATLTFTAVALNPVPGAVTITLTPAALTLAARALTPTPGPVTVTLTPAVLALAAVALTAGPTAVPASVGVDASTTAGSTDGRTTSGGHDGATTTAGMLG